MFTDSFRASLFDFTYHKVNKTRSLPTQVLLKHLVFPEIGHLFKVNLVTMPAIAGKYQHYKNEDIDDYFTAVGVPYMGRKMMSLSSPLMEIIHDGESMTIKSSSLLRVIEHSFKFGVEYEEKMPNTTIKSITTLINDDEMETKSVIPENGAKCGRHYKFSDDGVVVTLTHENATKPAKRYFRRI